MRIIVGFPRGGVSDILARWMGQSLSERLGQPFIVETRPGAGGTIATGAAAHAPPDGYTLLILDASAAINVTLYDKLDFQSSSRSQASAVPYPSADRQGRAIRCSAHHPECNGLDSARLLVTEGQCDTAAISRRLHAVPAGDVLPPTTIRSRGLYLTSRNRVPLDHR
jgi:hypothetical protein